MQESRIKTAELPPATATEIIPLQAGGTVNLRAGWVRKRIGEAIVPMLAYNGSIPGPTFVVAQDSQVAVHFINECDIETTVHWHGLRVDNLFDGVPHDTQAPVPPQGSFVYRLRFPDPGIYWYHPHMYEDYTQELGLYGSIIVTPRDPDYWPPANREYALMIDDILMDGDQIAPFSHNNGVAPERFGNVMLVNGETPGRLEVGRGEVVRFYLTNTANVRDFHLCFPGARVKLIGGDNGRVEQEAFVEQVTISPSERAVIDCYYKHAGQFAIEHRTRSRAVVLGTVDVSDQPVDRSWMETFNVLRHSAELEAERAHLAVDFDRQPDKTLILVGEMAGSGHHGGGHQHGSSSMETKMESGHQMPMVWKIIDQETGAVNHEIFWEFKTGERIKICMLNRSLADHIMHHPMHFHGERFLVLSRDGARNNNLVWKDTTLVRSGETVDILLEASNPGLWMAHCHIAEHAEGGMMFNFRVS